MMEKTLKESDVISGLLIVNFAVTLKVFSYQEWSTSIWGDKTMPIKAFKNFMHVYSLVWNESKSSIVVDRLKWKKVASDEAKGELWIV